MKYFRLLCCRPDSSNSLPSFAGPYFTSQDFLSQEISSQEFLFHAASASAAADGGGDAAEGMEVVEEFSSDGVRRGVLLSCPDGALIDGAGTERVPRPPYQEFLSFDESLLHSLDVRDDSKFDDHMHMRDDLLFDATKIIPTPFTDVRDETHVPTTPPRRLTMTRRDGEPDHDAVDRRCRTEECTDATPAGDDRSVAPPTLVVPRRPPCFRLFSEVSFVDGSECRDETAPATAAPAHHDGRSCMEASCVSVLFDDRRDEEPPWMTTGETDATHDGGPAEARSLSDDGAVRPCLNSKRKRSWKPRRLLVAIFR